MRPDAEAPNGAGRVGELQIIGAHPLPPAGLLPGAAARRRRLRAARRVGEDFDFGSHRDSFQPDAGAAGSHEAVDGSTPEHLSALGPNATNAKPVASVAGGPANVERDLVRRGGFS